MRLNLALIFGIFAGCGNDYGALPEFDLAMNVDFAADQGMDLAMDMGTDDIGPFVDDGGPDLVFSPGPSIVITSPAAGAIIGGTAVPITATITDPAGVLDNSVQAVFGGNSANSASLRRVTGTDNFAGTFDVSKLGITYVLPNLSVRATDLQGISNQTAIQVVVDNTPPIMSLTPPPMRYSKQVTITTPTGSVTGWECSQELNPVGDKQPKDGAVVPQIFWLRAMIMDRGNYAPGLNFERFAGVAPASVEIVAMPFKSGSIPLAVHTKGYVSDESTTVCDDINPNLLPAAADMTTSNPVVTVAMAPIPLQGAPDYTKGQQPGDGSTLPTGCDQMGEDNFAVPPPICPASDSSMSFILPIYFTPTSAIWTIPPVVAADVAQCVGTQFDSMNAQVPDGPTCVVVRGRDAVGNHTVSQVLRLCINHPGGTTCPGMATWDPNDSTTWPDCTGTYDPIANTVTNTPCTPRKFADGLVFPLH
jgi:hypothetical protein